MKTFNAFDYHGYTIIQFVAVCVVLGPAKLGDGAERREALIDVRTLWDAVYWIDQRILGRDRRSTIASVV